MFINGLVTIAILSVLALLTRSSFVFPSLGPTAILFFLAPNAESSRPVNALAGHAIGIVCGYAALLITGLDQAPSVMVSDVNMQRVVAASLALALTGAIMALTNKLHAPAGATTLIVALGFITDISDLIVIEVAVGLLALQALLINRAADTSKINSEQGARQASRPTS